MANLADIPKDRYNMDYVHFDNRKRIYVLLNHRVACLCWMDALRKDLIKPGAFLFHIDHHADFSLHSTALLDVMRRLLMIKRSSLKILSEPSLAF